jgi:hypothetical protein
MMLEVTMTTAADRDFLSIGNLAAHVQKPVRRIEQAADALKIKPALRLNSVPYFSSHQVDRLTKHLSNGNK